MLSAAHALTYNEGMQSIRSLFEPTPFKVSTTIALFFIALAIVHDFKPRSIASIRTISEKALDYKFSFRGYRQPKSKIIIVAGDEKSFRAFGQWPFDRAKVFAPLFTEICRHDPKVVGLDLAWSEPERGISAGVREHLTTRYQISNEKLDELVSTSGGDAAFKKGLQSCGNKLVMGYALAGESAEDKSDFQKRANLLITKGKNAILSEQRGVLTFPRSEDDLRGTVSFRHVAHGGILNFPPLMPENTAQGFFNNDSDSDGNYRRAMLFFNLQGEFVPSLPIRMAQKALSADDTPGRLRITADDEKRGLQQSLEFEVQTNSGTRAIPIDLYGDTIVNYRGPSYTFPITSMADVLAPADTLEYIQFTPKKGEEKRTVSKAEFFKDALVLVGITAVGLYDIRPRPFADAAFGVENHANVLDNALNGDFLAKPSPDLSIMFIIGMIFLSIAFAWTISKLDARWGALAAVGTIFGLFYVDQAYLFNQKNIVFSGPILGIQLLFQYLAVTVMKYMQEETEKKFIRSAFDKYVSPAIIDSMLSDPSKLKLGGEKKELSILFSDIRSFTQLSEKVDVKVLTQFLNEYLGSMTEILQAKSGTLDKYIGDAVMCFWGAPIDLKNHAELAVHTAVEMLHRLDALNVEFQRKYGFTIQIGIGINSGPVSVGNFGSNKVFEYTVIGDNVNLASRLEGLNKYYGTRIIISETTRSGLTDLSKFISREIDTVKVKGKAKSVKIYDIMPDTPAYSGLKQILPSFEAGLADYYGRRWSEAIAKFEAVLRSRTEDRPTLELIERCRHYISNPPENSWDGSWEMHSK